MTIFPKLIKPSGFDKPWRFYYICPRQFTQWGAFPVKTGVITGWDHTHRTWYG